MAQLTQPFNFSLPPLLSMQNTIERPQENVRPHYEDWENDNDAGVSPTHSESETSGSTSAPESRASHHDQENQEQHESDSDSHPVPQVGVNVVIGETTEMKPLVISTETPVIALDAKFHSYKQFEDAFESWKRTYYHPFRVASSETLKEPDGTVNSIFRYRYVVYHCAHYGEPRMRGIGKRPNQSYLPCGCRAMLRVNYNFQERVLKITTLEAAHYGHEQSEDVYNRATVKNRGSMSPAGAKRIKREFDSSFGSPLSVRNSACSSYQNSPASVPSPNTPFNPMLQSAMLQHQQFMSVLMNQQKENMSQLANQQLQLALGGLQRPIAPPTNPAMLNILNCLSSMPFMQQPAHGLVAPQPAVTMKQAMESSNSEEIDVVNDFKLPPDLPAPKPVFVKAEESDGPPVLEPETPIVEQQLPAPKPIHGTLASELQTIIADGPTPKKELIDVLSELSSKMEKITEEQATEALPQLRAILNKWNL